LYTSASSYVAILASDTATGVDRIGRQVGDADARER